MPAVLRILEGDWLTQLGTLPDESIDTCITSPPYWSLRDYSTCSCVIVRHLAKETQFDLGKSFGASGQISPEDERCHRPPNLNCKKCGGSGRIESVRANQLGCEPTLKEYIDKLICGFSEVWRVLRKDGTLWLNLGDTYNLGKSRTAKSDGYQRPGWEDRQSSLRVPEMKAKQLLGIPWRIAFALQDAGWILRCDIVWHKKNSMPESVADRPVRNHEYLFLFAKQRHYYYDAKAIMERTSPDTHARYARGRSRLHKYADGGPGDQTIAKTLAHMMESQWAGKNSRMHVDRDPNHAGKPPKRRRPGVNPKAMMSSPGSKQNADWSAANLEMRENRHKRSVWTLANRGYSGSHFATFPAELVTPCVLAGCPVGGVVLDPFFGAGTTGVVALSLGRSCVGIELHPDYVKEARRRCAQVTPGFALALTEAPGSHESTNHVPPEQSPDLFA